MRVGRVDDRLDPRLEQVADHDRDLRRTDFHRSIFDDPTQIGDVYLPQTSLARLGAAALAIVLITTACGSSTPTPSPVDHPTAQASAQPSSAQPGRTVEPGQTILPN